VHPRHPYVGDLVYTSFSGSHQDAIKKAFAARRDGDIWDMPYLPIDPKDLGRSYDAVIRVNSQSGKGGISYLLEADHGLQLPRRLQIEFSSSVQAVMDVQGKELTSADIWALLRDAYHLGEGEVVIDQQHLDQQPGGEMRLAATLRVAGQTLALRGEGNGPVEAFVDALQRASGVGIAVLDYHEHAIGTGAGARAAAYLELRIADTRTLFGVGIDGNIVTASMKAVVSGLLRSGATLGRQPQPTPRTTTA
jgi:2-isopropylmalate synthase